MDDSQQRQTITRREVIQRVTALLGGVALCGGDRLLAFSFDDQALSQAMARGAGTFSAADVALLDEIAETILPETSTPGAKAAKTGAFMALMVTDVYTAERAAGVSRRHAIGRRGVRPRARRTVHAGVAGATVARGGRRSIVNSTASWRHALPRRPTARRCRPRRTIRRRITSG